MRRAGVVSVIGAFLIALPAGVLEVTGADAAWEIDLLRFAGLGLLALGVLTAIIHSRGVAIPAAGATVRKVVAATLAAAFLVTANEVFLFFGFAALIHLTLYLLVPVLDHQYVTARARAGIS